MMYDIGYFISSNPSVNQPFLLTFEYYNGIYITWEIIHYNKKCYQIWGNDFIFYFSAKRRNGQWI